MHDISRVPEKYRRIVEVLLSWEGRLSDGYHYYAEFAAPDDLLEQYPDDPTLAVLVAIAREIIDNPHK